jgi:hypothetical protein
MLAASSAGRKSAAGNQLSAKRHEEVRTSAIVGFKTPRVLATDFDFVLDSDQAVKD